MHRDPSPFVPKKSPYYCEGCNDDYDPTIGLDIAFPVWLIIVALSVATILKFCAANHLPWGEYAKIQALTIAVSPFALSVYFIGMLRCDGFWHRLTHKKNPATRP